MVEAIIRKNLKLYKSHSVMYSEPVTNWMYQILKYNERETYELVSDWAEYTDSVTFETYKTCKMRTVFTPRKPQEHEESYFEFRLPWDCEAYVSIDGVRYAGIDNAERRCKVYLKPDMYDKAISVELEIYSCSFCDGERIERPLTDPCYVIVDKALADFSYLMDFLYDSIKYIKSEYTREKVSVLFENAIRASDVSLDYTEYRENIISIYNQLLDDLNAMKVDSDEGVIDCVASTHIDVAWLWQFKDTIRKSGRSALNQLRLMERYDEFEFSLSQPSVYNYIKEVYPDIFEQIKQRVKDGKWRLIGPMWVESDLNISGAESLIREFLYGHQFFKEEFGKTSDVCWIPDSFGFPASLPQIFSKCGMKSFYTTKVRWQTANEFPYNVFVWEGIDKSRMLATVPLLRDYYNNYICSESIRYASDKMQQKNTWDRVLMAYGFGDGGGGVTSEMLENYRLLQKVPGMPKVNLTRAEDYYEALDKKRDKLPVWKGELCVETHQGTYTTIAKVKRNNRYAEMAFRRLDLLSAIMCRKGKDPDYAQTVKKWKDMLLLQFHDVLPGSSIDPVYSDAERIYGELFDFAEKKQKELVSEALFSEAENKVTVYNPNSFSGSAYAKVDKKYADCGLSCGDDVSNVITDAEGNCYIYVKDLPGFASRTYTKTACVTDAKRIKLNKSGEKILVETPYFSFSIFSDGTLHDFYDKRANRIVSENNKGLNNFVTYKDGPEMEDAWNIDKEYKMRPANFIWENTIEIIEENNERAVVKVTKKHENTLITQNIVIYADIARVDFVSHIDWQEKYKILQVSFPVNVTATQASYEIAYGIVKRNTHANTPAEHWKHEYAAHRFTDLSDDRYGVALLNDCKYGHNVIDNDMIMTLFRNTDNPSRFLDTGEHDFSYSLLPHEGGLYAGNVVQEGYLFNSPFIVFDGECNEAPILKLSNNGLVVDCIKPAEDGNGYIVRAYEPYGVPGTVEISLCESSNITEVSPLEEKICDIGNNDSFTVNYTPFEIRTFRIS